MTAGWEVSCGWRPTEHDPEPRDYPRSYPSWSDARQIGRALACGDNVISVTITAPDGSEAASWTRGGVWRERAGLPEEPEPADEAVVAALTAMLKRDPVDHPRKIWVGSDTVRRYLAAIRAHYAGRPIPDRLDWFTARQIAVEAGAYRPEDPASPARLIACAVCDALHELESQGAPPAPTSGEGGQ